MYHHPLQTRTRPWPPRLGGPLSAWRGAGCPPHGLRLRAAETRTATEPASPTGRDPSLARLEAVLFLAREPLSSRKLARLANLADGTRARTLVRQLREKYNRRGAAFQVEEVAGGFQLMTRSHFSAWLRRLEQTPGELRLSGPALETLSVVAYRQPVLRADVEAIRGVQCGEILRQLMERDLVRIAGRADELGRPFLYGTTRHFLQLFGLKHLDELPRADELRGTEIQVAAPVANMAGGGNDSQLTNVPEGNTDKEPNVTATVETPQDEELLSGAPVAEPPHAFEDEDDFEEEEYEFDEDEDEDEEYEDEDLDDEEYEDEDEYEDDDEEYEDEDDEELEGDWEEVDDEDEEEPDDEEYEDEDEDEYEEDDEEYEDEYEEDEEEYEDEEDEYEE